MTERLLTVVQAAKYLGVSRTFFLKTVRPLLPGEVDVRSPESEKPMLRWTVDDLDAYIASRRKERKTA